MKTIEVKLLKIAIAMQKGIPLLINIQKCALPRQTEKHKKLFELIYELGKQIVEILEPLVESKTETVSNEPGYE